MRRINERRSKLTEADAEEFVVLIALKGPQGAYDQISYADEETDIDFEQGIYGYDAAIRDNVSAMTRDRATGLANDIIENAPAGDVLVGVVPYSTIPNGGGSSPAEDSADLDSMNDDIESAEEDFEIPEDEGEEDEEDEGEEVEESYKPFHKYGSRVTESARKRAARKSYMNSMKRVRVR